MKPRRHRAMSRLEAVILLSAAACAAVFVGPRAWQARQDPQIEEARAKACQGNLKQLALGVMQYVQDYDEKYPLVSVRTPRSAIGDPTPFGWADAILPYTKNMAILQCPSEGHESSTTRVLPDPVRAPGEPSKMSDAVQLSGFSDFWFNAHLAGRSLADMTHPAQTLLFGDGDGAAVDSNARYHLYSLPDEWLLPASPARRHLDAANYAFADGHVAALKPAEISNDGNAPATFAPDNDLKTKP